MSYPLVIEDAQLYERHKFMFSFAFLFQEDVETAPYKLVLKKLADFLRMLEVDSQFLSKGSTRERFIRVRCHHLINRITARIYGFDYLLRG